jgi:hypothetical protein
MKKTSGILLFLVAAVSLAQAQSAVSKPFRFILGIDDYVRSYVVPRIEQWQQQGRYESADEYRRRVTEAQRNEKIRQLTGEAIDAYKQLIGQHVRWAPLRIIDYDANSQLFLIRSEPFGDFTLYVPRTEAEAFERNFELARKVNPDFYFTDRNIRLGKLTFITAAGERYTYYSGDPRRFDPVRMPSAWPPIRSPALTPVFDSTPAFARQLSTDSSTSPASGLSDVDVDIPVREPDNTNTYVVIIGNEHYKYEPQTLFAANDAAAFYEYVTKTLGVPPNNVYGRGPLRDATVGSMMKALDFLRKSSRAKNGNVHCLFYYAGHGMADKDNRQTFLLPVDACSDILHKTALKTTDLYADLIAMNPLSATVFLDACFSGVTASGPLTALHNGRGIAIEYNPDVLHGNLVVFSAATGTQTAYPYREKGHGIFTYFLLKRLKETRGHVTFGELSDYLVREVKSSSWDINRQEQTPSVQGGYGLGEQWKEWQLLKTEPNEQ